MVVNSDLIQISLEVTTVKPAKAADRDAGGFATRGIVVIRRIADRLTRGEAVDVILNGACIGISARRRCGTSD